MEQLYILDKLGLDDGCKIEGAIFLTYSIDCKSILAALLKMFTANKSETFQDTKKETNKRKELVAKFQQLLEKGMGDNKEGVEAYKELKEKVAFVCNDGQDKSIASPIYWYTKELTYYYKTEHSFHPKLYILKYTKEIPKETKETSKETYFRIMVGTMNFVDSQNLDMMVVKDIRAYDDDNQGERCQCNILNELLDYNTNNNPNNNPNNAPSRIANRSSELKTVLDNLNLDKLYFDKEVIPEFIVFNGNANPMQDKTIQKVMSPFLTLDEEYALRDNLKVYTMESELNKKGWFVSEEKGNDISDILKKEFCVYKADVNEPQYNHTKLYVVEENDKKAIYIGSTNFSKAACTKNKEILVKLKITDQELDALEKELFRDKDATNNYGYICKTFIKKKEEGNKDDILRNLFKKLSSALSMRLEQKINKENEGFCISINYSDQLLNETEIKETEIKEIVTILGLSETETINIKIIPFLMKSKSISIGNITKEGLSIMQPQSFKINISDRCLLDERFLFSYCYSSGEKKAIDKEYCFSVKTSRLELENATEISSRYMLTYLQTFLADRKSNDNMITKELESIMKGHSISLSSYCSKFVIPDLESMLKEWLDNPKNYSVNGKKIEEIQKLLSEGNLTQVELKNLGITPMEKKLVDNLYTQWDELKKEIN